MCKELHRDQIHHLVWYYTGGCSRLLLTLTFQRIAKMAARIATSKLRVICVLDMQPAAHRRPKDLVVATKDVNPYQKIQMRSLLNGRVPGKRRRHDMDETPVPIPVMKTQQLVIGDEAEVDKFYQVRFKDMQQFSCKIMGKAFVKLVEPKKQTHYPYTKGAEKAPPWWPETSGDNHVRHREPDHLLKAGKSH